VWRREGDTSVCVVVDVLIDGVQEVLLFPAQLPGSQHVAHTLVEVGVLALQGAHTAQVSARPTQRNNKPTNKIQNTVVKLFVKDGSGVL